eukprot:4881372-Prymnesium_polylepis.1
MRRITNSAYARSHVRGGLSGVGKYGLSCSYCVHVTAWYGRDAWARLLSHGVECEGGHRAAGAGSGRDSCGSCVCIYPISSSRYAHRAPAPGA